MSKGMFAKSTAAAVAPIEDGAQLSSEFSDAMQELDAFVKSNGESAPIVSKAKPFDKMKEDEEEEEEEEGEKPHDKDDEGMMAKAEERNLEVPTHGQKAKKKTMHAHTMHKSVGEEEEEVHSFDGEEIIAGFQKSLSKVSKSVSMLMDRFEAMQEQNAKLTLMLAKAVRAEGNLIKAVAGEVSLIGQTARPRKSVLTVFEKSASGALPVDESKAAFDGKAFLAKSVDAAAANRISPVQVGEIRQMLTMNQPVPEHLVKLVEGK